MFTLLDVCVSSLRRGHANHLCVVLILADDPRRESEMPWHFLRTVVVGELTRIHLLWLCVSSVSALPEAPDRYRSASGPGGTPSRWRLAWARCSGHVQYVYIYIYIHRERERERDMIVYIYIYIYVYTRLYI